MYTTAHRFARVSGHRLACAGLFEYNKTPVFSRTVCGVDCSRTARIYLSSASPLRAAQVHLFQTRSVAWFILVENYRICINSRAKQLATDLPRFFGV